MMLFIDILAIVLILFGALLCLSAAIGLARFRDTVSRMHTSSKPQTLGLISTLLGALIYVLAHGQGGSAMYGDLGLLALIMLFAVGTSPIIGNRLGHEAIKEHLIDEENLTTHELAVQEQTVQQKTARSQTER